MANVTFQPVQEAGLDVLMTLIQEYYDYDGHSFDPQAIAQAVKQFIQDDTYGKAWLICHDHQPIGYVVLTLGYSLEYRGRDAFIDEIYLREAYRRQGIGTATFKFVEEVCVSLNVQALHLEVERHNVTAQQFYQRIGYEDHDRYMLTKWIGAPTSHPPQQP